ncbi:MAG TPA: ABC transporter substrate binding protein, partial [Methylomirabilota bacterium]|nr:ABC transporter substrate binding protein [Methylomirabilota bacterium]
MSQKIVLTLLAVLLLVSVDIAHAQHPNKIPHIGVLRVGGPPDAFIDAFREGLQQVGYTEGKNIIVDYRWLKREDQFVEAAEELTRARVDIIVATSTPGALAAKHATQSIPIVVPVMGDPIGSGLVAGLAHPGGNLTGLSSLAPDLWPKR